MLKQIKNWLNQAQYIKTLEHKLATLSDLADNYRQIKESQYRHNLIVLAGIVMKFGGKVAISHEFMECVSTNPNLFVKSTLDKENNELVVELVQKDDDSE